LKVFLSWSGQASGRAARVFKEWLTQTVFVDEQLEVFMSEEDIVAGSDWLTTLKTQLVSAHCAIVFLTEENLRSPWLNFEGGYIAVTQDKKAIPFLVDVKPSTLRGPFTHFQNVDLSPEKVKKLITDLKKIGNLGSLNSKHLDALFPSFYEELNAALKRQLDSVTESTDTSGFQIYPTEVSMVKKGKVFIGVPMASIAKVEYAKMRSGAMQIKQAILTHTKLKDVYCPVENIVSTTNFDSEKKAIFDDFRVLKESEYYIFLYPKRIASSVLLEMGYAIALSKKTRVFTNSRSELPFMLRQADEAVPNLFVYEYKEFSEIAAKIKSQGDAFFY
jgi:hypothetical protein